MLPLLVAVLAAALLAVPSAAQFVQQPDGYFRSWSIVDMAPQPSSGVVYLLDDYSTLRTINSTTGRELPFFAPLTQYPASVRTMAVDPASNVVHALTARTDRGGVSYNAYQLVTLSAELQPLYNVTLSEVLSPPLTRFEELMDTVLVDRSSAVYLFRRLSNHSLLVHVLQYGKQIDTWLAPVPAAQDREWTVALGAGSLIHFRATSYQQQLATQPVYITTTGGLAVATLNLYANFTRNTAYWFNAMAVSRQTGNIAISSGYAIHLYTSTGVRLPSFTYASPLETYGGFRRLAFDGHDRLLAVDYADEYGVQVIQPSSGDVLGTVSNGVPQLAYTRAMWYERDSRSLLLAQQYSDTPIVRVDADRGFLLQEYPLTGRFVTSCYTLASTLGALSGDVYNLLSCTVGDWNINRQVVLHVVNRAGQVRRQVTLNVDSLRQNVDPVMAVSEDKQLFYLVFHQYDPDYRNRFSRVSAYAFNGTNVFNASDPLMGRLGPYTQLLLVDGTQLALVDEDNYRIALLDAANGAFFGNISVPQFTIILATTYAAGQWYRSEATFDFDTYDYNVSINQYASDDGSLQARYLLETVNDNVQVAEVLTVDGDGRRLYALQSASVYGAAVVYWDLRRADEQTQATGQQQDGVRHVQPSSGRQVLTAAPRRQSGHKDNGRPAVAAAPSKKPSVPVARDGFEQLMHVIEAQRGERMPEFLKQMNAKRTAMKA